MTFSSALHKHEIFDTINTVVSNHFHSVTILLFSIDHVISMECSAFDFRCQCTQQKLQSICAILTFDPQLQKHLNIFCKRRISIKLFYLYQRLQYRDNYSFRIKFVFFLYLRMSASKESDLSFCIYFWYQTDRGVRNTSIYSAVSLASPYYNYL